MERKISIVIPAYNEEESVNELYNQIMASINDMISDKRISDYEIWFISDGSTDGTENVVKTLADNDNKVHLIAFRKNFGKAAALSAGFHHVTGDIIFTMDSDLQDDPVEFPRFIQKIDEGYDLVSGWKYNRLDPMEKKLPSKLFNKVTSKFSGIELHDFDCGFKAYLREVVDSIDVYGEFHRYMPVLAYRKGFRIGEITVQHHKREHGKSKYGFERYLRGLFDSITTTYLLKFFDRPMYLFGRFGIIAALLAFVMFVVQIVLWIVNSNVSGASLMLISVMLLCFAAISIMIGLLGNTMVEATHKYYYSEEHIKTII